MAKSKDPNFNFDKYFSEAYNRNKKRFSNKDERKKLYYAGGIVGAIFLALLIYVISGLPSLEELENPKPQLASKVYGINGELIGTISIENRIETNIDSLPSYMVTALVSTEDKKFYSHWGVDLVRFGKAMVKNIFFFKHEGASTITQQLANNLYHFKVHDENSLQTMVRKVREWITAVQIERTFTKREILQMYLNVSYFGRSAYGVESAARVYFNKKGKDLTLPECAMFVALLKSPEYYDPVKHYDHAMRRRNQVMLNMVDNSSLDEATYNNYKDDPIDLVTEKTIGNRSDAPYFIEYVRQQLLPLSEKYGFDIYRDGLNIYTSLDLRMQQIANKAAAEHLKQYQPMFSKFWDWKQHQDLLPSVLDRAIKDSRVYNLAKSSSDRAEIYNRLKYDKGFIDSAEKAAATMQVGFIALDPTNGQIRAMVGGQNLDYGRGLNHATGIKRQPGSGFKPFAYTVAVDNGYYPAYTLLNQRFNYNGWSPDNFENDYGGYMTLREALAHSINVVAGRLTIGNIAPPWQVAKYAHRMGIQSQLAAYPSIALGTSEVSPLEITSAYGTFANGGVHVNPIAILRIEDRDGQLIDKFVPDYQQAISPQTASVMTSMLQDVINYGTGAGARKYFQYPCAGKTGTTQNFSDAWFIGYTPKLCAGVWVGFDDHRIKFTSAYGQGARAAMPIWAMFMEGAYKQLNLPVKYFTMADGVDTVGFCRTTMEMGEAKLATGNCPSVARDIIIASNPPPKCDIHGRGGGSKAKKEDKNGDTGW